MDASLIINPGSASRKYALARGSKVVLRGHFERDQGSGLVTYFYGDRQEQERFKAKDFAGTSDRFLAYAEKIGLIDGPTDIDAIGLRIVAPGPYFAQHRKIDRSFLAKLRAAAEAAPLHIKPEFVEHAHVHHLLKLAPVYAISDSAFHATMPDEARQYAIKAQDAKRYWLYRNGYHGISVASVVRQSTAVLGKRPRRMVVCHLGGGASVTAVKDGKTIDTSMGLTPLEGIVMATRSGSVDPGVLIKLGRAKRWSWDDLEHYLNKESGIRGLTGGTDDMYTVVQRFKAGDAVAESALRTYVYRLAKQIGSYAAVLGGLDAIVLTATIGERSDVVRTLLAAQLRDFGVRLDAAANRRASQQNKVVTTKNSPIIMAVVRTDELGEMAHQLAILRRS